MRNALGDAAPSEDEIEEIIRAVDADNSGTIDFDEFITLMSDPKFNHLAKDEHRDAFKSFDRDGNGLISVAELKATFSGLGQRLDDDQFNAILDEADLDGDRHIDYKEFLQMLKS